MRIKMRSLVSFLGFAVAIFMLGDLFLFSSVGRHGRRLAADDPYHVTDGRFLKRRIKSGKEYLSEGVRHFADRLYDGSDATDNPDGSRYDGVRDSVLGAMEVPGMKRKILPLARNKDLGELGLSGDLYRLEQLEKDLMAGTLHEEEEREEGQDLADNRAEDDYWGEDSEVRITTEVTNPEDNNIPADDQGFGFSWSNIFGLGRKESSSDSDVLDQSPDGTDHRGPEDRDRRMERYENINWNIGDMDAAGLDSSVLSKLTFVQEDQLFQKKPTDDGRIVEVAPPSDEYLERERLATELRQIKDLANSIPDWQDDVPKTAPTPYPVRSLADNVPASQDGESQSPSSIQRFFSSLFQPLSFAGTTGDEDEDDGGWASVAELDHFDSLIDEVNQMMIPGVNWKLQPQETVVIQEKGTSEGESSAENVPSSEPSLKVNMVAVPGFETDFFQKFGDMKQEEAPEYAMPDTSLSKDEISDDRQVAGIPSDFFSKFFQSANAPDAVPPAVPESSAAAAAPAAEGAQPDTLQVPSIPGLTEDFFNKYAKLTDFSEVSQTESGESGRSQEVAAPAQFSAEDIKVPNIPGLTDTFFNKYSGTIDDAREEEPGREPAEALQVPNIPGLTDDFFNKYGVQKPSEEAPIGVYQTEARDIPEPEVPLISADLFDKFIHPVAQGHAPPELVAENLQGVPGLPPDFFDKYMKGQGVQEDGLDYEGVPDQNLEMPDISGLEDYFSKYMEDADLLPGETVGFESLKESLRHAQLQVPGMSEKVIPEDVLAIAPDLPDVPPSEYPEMNEETPDSGVLSYLMSKLLGTKKHQFGEGLPVLPPGSNMSIPDAEPVPESPPGWETAETGNETAEVHHPGQEEIDLQKVLKALLPNVSTSNDSLGLADARGFLSQLEGIIPGTVGIGGLSEEKGNMSEKLANITSLEDSRIVECNLTKSPNWKVAITDRWHTVQDGLMFVYSAYLDDRILGHTAIRILGILEGWEVGMHLKPHCQVWFQDKTKPFVVGATYEWLPGQPIAKFKAVLLTCVYQTSRVEGKPLAVSLTTEPCDQPNFLVKIHTRNETVGVKKTNFTICLTGPMKFGYADVGQFIQWMEFNIMMGVERFVLYNHSMDAALRPYLVHYAKLGYVQLFPWIIPDNIPNPLVFLKNLGHLAMINDCLYRNMWTSRYVIFMDIDEMILPRYGHVTFEPMLRNAGCHRKPQAIVQSVFFRREWPNDELFNNNQTVLNMGLVGLLKTKRERKIWPPYMRSKYFIKPDEVLICNVHATHTFLSPLDYQDLSCIFNPKEVVLHHYRYWGEVTGNYVVDRRLHEYADELITRAGTIYEAVLGRKVT